MLKEKPLLIAAIIFGGIGLVLIITGCLLYMINDSTFLNMIDSVFGFTKGSTSPATFSQLGIVFEASAFILIYRSLVDEI